MIISSGVERCQKRDLQLSHRELEPVHYRYHDAARCINCKQLHSGTECRGGSACGTGMGCQEGEPGAWIRASLNDVKETRKVQ